MRLFGFEVTRAKHVTPTQPLAALNAGWWPLVREPFTGAFQRNMELRLDTVLSYSAVYACVTLISSDIAKLRLRLMQQRDSSGIWVKTESPAFSPVLRKPNLYQNRIQFLEYWVTSKLIHGNTYVLKERDDRNVVKRLYVIDPTRTRPLVSPDGSVFYEIAHDDLARVTEGDPIRVPASEIIHDRYSPLYYPPLLGISPLSACWLPASQGLSIQRNSATFFRNGSRPGGILTAPAHITDETAKRLKDYWDANFTGENTGKLAVMGDGLKYESLSVNAEDSQLIEQLKKTAEDVCTAFKVPAYMIGVGPPPNYSNIEALNQQYYNQCLQKLIEDIELCLDEGLGLSEKINGTQYGTELDIRDLLRMDTATKVKSWSDLVSAGIASPNEARNPFDLLPVEGGESPLAQQQNYSLAALAKRDAKEDPFATAAPAQNTEPDDNEPDEEEPEDVRGLADQILSRAKHYEFTEAA